MPNSTTSNIKRAQKESLYFKALSRLFHSLSQEDKHLEGIFITRVKLSADKSICTIYFYTAQGLEHFEEALDVLKLYKPSLRKNLASEIKTRYVPELYFRFDDNFEKQERIESLLNQVSKEPKDCESDNPEDL